MTKELIHSSEYRQLITELKNKVQGAQSKAALKINETLISLYWDIGKRIVEQQQQSQWGDNAIGQIAQDLTQELGGIKGFSRRNLYRMMHFHQFYSDQDEKVAQLVP